MISISIIHAPWSPERAANVQALLHALPEAVVVSDTNRVGALKVANRLGCWPMAERAWLSHHRDASYHLVLEDDAELCDGFRDHVIRAIESRPNAALSLFRGSRDCSVATILPVPVIAPWIEWVRTASRGVRFLPHHDWLIAEGMKALGVPRLFAVPSLVNHREFSSLLQHEHVRAIHFDPSPTECRLEPA